MAASWIEFVTAAATAAAAADGLGREGRATTLQPSDGARQISWQEWPQSNSCSWNKNSLMLHNSNTKYSL